MKHILSIVFTALCIFSMNIAAADDAGSIHSIGNLYEATESTIVDTGTYSSAETTMQEFTDFVPAANPAVHSADIYETLLAEGYAQPLAADDDASSTVYTYPSFASLLPEACAVLVAAAAEPSTDPEWFEAAKKGNIEALRAFQRRDPFIIDAKDKPNDILDLRGNTALMYASIAGDKDAVNFLVEKHADIDAQNNHGITALMFAICSQYQNVIALLLKKGADTDIADGRGYTALMWAASVGDTATVKKLIKDHYVDVNTQGKTGHTALHYAVAEGFLDTAKVLLKHGADPSIENNYGESVMPHLDKIHRN